MNSNSNLVFEDLEEEEEPTTWDRFSQKFKDQPLVPIGAGATTIALLGAGRAIQQGNSNGFNLWCRYRIIFQGLTLVAALGGSLYYNKQREIDRVTEEEDRRRKRDARILEQEQNPVNVIDQSRFGLPIESKSIDSSEARRTFLKKKMAEQTKLEGRPLKGSGSSHSTQES